jgi:hypothetical protein
MEVIALQYGRGTIKGDYGRGTIQGGIALRCMDHDPNLPDAKFYLRKAAHYRDKAKVITDAVLRTALEALAREYELRARDAGGAVEPNVGKSNPVRFPQTSWHHH